MANCYSNLNTNSNYTVVSGASCVSPNDFDSLCNYNSNRPFANLPGPTSDSKIKTYWKRGDVTYPLKCKLTWNEYISYQKIPIGTKLGTTSLQTFSSSGKKGNGLNNPVNLSYGDIAKMYGSTGSKTMSDGQKNAVFPDIESGLAAAMHFIKKKLSWTKCMSIK